MVKEILVDILKTQKERLTGEDIKHIIESIQIVESSEIKKDDRVKTQEQIVKEWLGE